MGEEWAVDIGALSGEMLPVPCLEWCSLKSPREPVATLLTIRELTTGVEPSEAALFLEE
jgi:hypothetical protein